MPAATNTRQTSQNGPAPTRPRLQAINQDFPDVNEQVEQAAHIIGLPDRWTTKSRGERGSITKSLVRARAEWVLRWTLDKLKDVTAAGKTARGTAALWTLLDWMLETLPVSRSAPHLRDAAFPAILERTLTEHFAQIQFTPPTSHDIDTSDVSGSGETIGEITKPSKKRKRGAAGANSPSAHVGLRPSELRQLFLTVGTVVRSIISLTNAQSQGEDAVQAELMKVVLRTDSVHAASMLKNWVMAIERLLVLAPTSSGDQHLAEIVDLSLVTDIWELRTVAADDEAGSSADDFSAECLVPVLTLLDALGALRSVHPDQIIISAIDRANRVLERLLARHLFAPARAAFQADADKTADGTSKHQEATLLVSNLAPLRARLLQAAQIEDEGEAVPAELTALSGASSQLLDLAIRISPSNTPKSKLAEKPWIEAVVVALLECAGCSLASPPEFVTPRTAIELLVGAIGILQAHHVSLRSNILKDLFWYYSGVKYPIGKDKQVHWSLIASLVELDSSVFVTEPRGLTEPSTPQQTDLAQVIFEEISKTQFDGPGFATNVDLETTSQSNSKRSSHSKVSSTVVLDQIIVPLMSGFVKNRSLLGFVRRWDDQLVKAYRHENRKALKECKDVIWEDRVISQALAQRVEQALTQGQIVALLQEHIQRMSDLSRALSTEADQDVNVKKLAAYKRAASTAIIIPTILQSISFDETIEAVKPQLRALLQSYSLWVRDDHYDSHTRLFLSWLTLCQLVAKLWPVELHGSIEQQEELLSPLIEQSVNDVSAASGKRVDSPTRAAAMLFLLDVCDHLQTLPGSKDLIRPSLDKVLQVSSTGGLESNEHVRIVQFFCAHFIQLFGYLGAEASERSLQQLLAAVSGLNGHASNAALRSLSQVIFEQGGSSLQDIYAAVLVQLLENGDEGARSLAISSLTFVQPTAISRERRESLLDHLTNVLVSHSLRDATALLSVMVRLMQASNATAKISSDGVVFLQITDKLQKSGLVTPTTLQLLQQLVELTLSQVVFNQSQSQNMIYLGKLKGRIDNLAAKGKQCSAANLAILRATFAVQKQNALLQPKQYVSVLKTSLINDSSTGDAAKLQDVIDAFNELSTTALADAKLLESTQAWLRSWINDNADLESYMITGGQGPVELAEYVARLHITVAKYKLYPSMKWLVNLTLKCLREPLSEQHKIATSTTMKDVFTQLPIFEKLNLVHVLTNPTDASDVAPFFHLLNTLISTFEDRLESNVELRNNQLALLPRLCKFLLTAQDHACFNAILSSINTVLSQTPSLATQYSIEVILAALSTLTSRSAQALPAAHAPAIYARLCETTRLILLLHRGRLGGRFHIFLSLLQNLLFLLFTPHSGRGALPLWLRGPDVVALTPANGVQFARVLSTLCNPPQSSIQKTHTGGKTSKTLNDPVKAARERTSAFLYPLLASYSRFQLSGRLEPSVREKVTPGIWEVVGTASLSRDGLDAMFAGLGKSERDVWRGVWSEWEAVHGRKDLLSGDVI